MKDVRSDGGGWNINLGIFIPIYPGFFSVKCSREKEKKEDRETKKQRKQKNKDKKKYMNSYIF